MLTEYNYVGRLLKFLQKLFQGKKLKENRICEFVPDTCKIQVCTKVLNKVKSIFWHGFHLTC